MRTVDSTTSASDILAYFDRLRAAGDVDGERVAFLAEDAAIYAERGTGDSERLRASVLASFEETGLPDAALPIVMEELENGLNPHVVAAAARAVRGAPSPPDRVAPLLLNAIERLRDSDDLLSFPSDARDRHGQEPITALMELFRTLTWLGPRAHVTLPALHDMEARQPPMFAARVQAELTRTILGVQQTSPVPSCCADESAPPAEPLPSRAVDLWQIELQDQHGATFTFSDFLGARPTILSFFYTRCMNPNKCSLTVTKLARLQRQSQAKGWCGLINIAAITYDPAYDLPHRLHAYGANRGMIFDLHTRLMRTTGSFEPLRQGLRLGVGYGPTTVNQHRLDTLIFDAAGDPVMNLARVQWHESDVLHALEALLRGTERPTPRSR